jgi:DNA-binding transcriptional regulator YdaS (Cro superfamily)
MTELKRAIEHFGGVSALAKSISVSRQVVDNWSRRNAKVPAIHAIKIEIASNGAVPISCIRPDIYELLKKAGYKNANTDQY